jgi:carbamoyl-phosphate synthase/aspartate carbamoyltransferase
MTAMMPMQAKQLGFSDKQLANCMGSTELAVRRLGSSSL